MGPPSLGYLTNTATVRVSVTSFCRSEVNLNNPSEIWGLRAPNDPAGKVSPQVMYKPFLTSLDATLAAPPPQQVGGPLTMAHILLVLPTVPSCPCLAYHCMLTVI